MHHHLLRVVHFDAFGGTLMPVDKDKMVRTSVIVPADVYQQVQDLAARHDVSAAWIMRHALLEFLAVHKHERSLPLERGRSLAQSAAVRTQKRS